MPGWKKRMPLMARADRGPMLAKLAERFKPEAVYGKASRRGAYMVVDLKSPADISELMYALHGAQVASRNSRRS
jgi:hypothetical protein